MPLVDEKTLKALLADGSINAISVDTNIFDQKRLNLNSAAMQAIARLKPLSFDYILSSTVAEEVKNHLQRATQEALQKTKKCVGKAIFYFETEQPTRDEILDQITGGKSAENAANERWARYVTDTGCQIINDYSLVDTSILFAGYFAGEPPFGTGEKKNEFPDAAALHALERTAIERGAKMLVVSKDGDWKAFCEKSQNLYVVTEIERALGLIRNAPPVLAKVVHTWLVEEGDGSDVVFSNVAFRVENFEFTASAYPTFGEAEVYALGGELISLEWPRVNEIDVIDFEEIEAQAVRIVMSMPLDLVVRTNVELDFHVWDGIDKESVSMGGRSIEVDEEFTVLATLTAEIYSLGSEDQEILFANVEIDDPHHEIELGEVDVFEQEED